MFNIKLEEKSIKMSLKARPVKIQRSKKRQGGTMCSPSRAGKVKKIANLTGKLPESYKYLECKIFRILLKYVTDH